ncbi:hypothetical protein HK101_007815 [Irineochytrium annulatum]|nr:hypothetical protein HK101_007815 [Irineochytrium annulatum]
MTLSPSTKNQMAQQMMETGTLHPYLIAKIAAASAAVGNTTVSNATSATGLTSEALSVFKDVATEFNSNLLIGTPPQTLRVLLDTGSFQLWLRGRQCNTASCVGAPAFNPDLSSTFQTSHKTATPLEYADGTKVTGFIGSDVVAVNGDVVENFEFTIATSLTSSNPVGDLDSDGIVGMSLTPTDSSLGAYPIFFERLMGAGKVQTAQFAYYIDSTNNGGEVTFGGYDTAVFNNPAEPPVWVGTVSSSYFDNENRLPFASEGAWALPILSITSDTPSVSFTFPGKAGALMDTGTSIAVVPQSLLRSLVKAVGAQSDGQGDYIVDCAKASATGGPVLSFNYANNVTLKLTAAEYITQVAASDDLGNVVSVCIIALQAVEDSMNYALLGNTVLKRFVTIFDYKASAIGFALAKGRPAIVGASVLGIGSANPTVTGGSGSGSPGSSSSGASATVPLVSQLTTTFSRVSGMSSGATRVLLTAAMTLSTALAAMCLIAV